MTCRRFAEGQVLFRERDPADCVFRLLSGAVDILRELDGDPIQLCTVGAGQFIGEMGVVENRPRSAIAPAPGDCALTTEPPYQLKSDTVDWTMQISRGKSCVRGFRHGRATIHTAKLISPPQSGQVKLLGSGFSYTAKSDFRGQDSFTIQVSGMLNGIHGSSDIRIIASVGPK